MTKRGHKNSHNDLTYEFVREVFDYNPESGELYWKKNLSIRNNVGRIAGYVDDQNRIKIGVRTKEYMAHRLIWLWMTRQWPPFEIDHVNRIKCDNRWKNLRLATPSENHRNRGLQKNNTSGYKGVSYDKINGYWIAQISIQGRHCALGTFATAKEAHSAYKKAALSIHGSEWEHW